MKREILFRGKRVYNGEWVEGNLIQYGQNDFRILAESGILTAYHTLTETVGQFTGLTDKNGVKIFEGDIVENPSGRFIVKYDEDLTSYILEIIHCDWSIEDDDLPDFLYEFQLLMIEIIGNIHDNPELLNQ